MVESIETEIGKGTCTINTYDRLHGDFKKAFFHDNVIYEVK